MLLNKDGTVKILTLQERIICASGTKEDASKSAIAARINLLAPLREVLQPVKAFSGRVEQTAQADL